jgi:hypothetical protein
MLTESKINKRNKFAGHGSDEPHNKSPNAASAQHASSTNSSMLSHNSLNNQSNANNGSSSKWVSGGFDLEEHIAALPQLADSHLISAIGNQKPTLTGIARTLTESGEESAGALRLQHSNASSPNSRSTGGSSSVDEFKIAFDPMDDKSIEPDLHASTTNPSTSTSHVNATTAATASNDHPEGHLNSSADIAEKIVERLNISHSSQPLECDGLVALAEVALQQAHRISSPSCT